MKLTYLGHSSFLLQSKKSSVLTDPFQDIGIPFPDVSSEVVTISHDHFDHNAAEKVKGVKKIFKSAGNFVWKEIEISAIERYHDEALGKKRGKSLVFCFQIEGMRFCHLGDIGEPFPEELLALSKIDVLMIPVGGNYTIGPSEAFLYVQKLNPKIVVPMHYYVPNLKVDIQPPDEFLRKFQNVRMQEGTLSLKREELPERTQVIFFKRSN